MARRNRAGSTRLAIALLGVCASAALALQAPDDIDVDVREVGNLVVIDVAMHVAAPPRVAWDVLTDFDNMARIVSSVESSRVLEGSAERVVVHQTGAYHEGLLRFGYETLREVRLTPYSAMQSRLIRGTLARLDGDTRLAAAPGGGTQIVSHGECVPGQWIPPVVGRHFIARATRLQYAEMRREMLRRAAVTP
jgi:uncharacterized membrane protein